MFAVAGMIIGALLGAWRAKKLGGNLADMLQYAAGFGLAFFLLFMFLTVIADWQGWV